MADYRLSAQVIKRSEGKSSVASAAYRSGQRLVDERTGIIHDYSRKGGVLHSEILSPDKTPEWMHDRAQLWNAVEAVERRKDAQLAREIQLSLPHELTHEQRVELVQDFVQEQFVEHGMIADIAVHAPGKDGDERNHHAHIMLTMRDVMADGFGKKNREWNSPETLTEWREHWALYQNLALERHGHHGRVDHRSYEAQGIDREPTQHLGPTAFQMETNGKPSRIGDENRERQERNSLRAQYYAAEFALAQEIAKRQSQFVKWKEKKEREIEAAQDLHKLDLSQKHALRRDRLESDLQARHATAKATIAAEIQATQKKLDSSHGLKGFFRDVLGRTRSDEQRRDDLAKTLRSIEQAETLERNKLEREIKAEKQRVSELHERRKAAAQRSIEHRKEQLKKRNYMARKEALHSRPEFQRDQRPDKSQKLEPRPTIETQKPLKPSYEQANDNAPAKKSPENARRAVPKPVAAPTPRGVVKPSQRSPQPPAEPSERLSLDDKKRISDVHLGDKKTLDRPWQQASDRFSHDRFGQRDNEHKGRERSPFDKPGGGKGRKPE